MFSLHLDPDSHALKYKLRQMGCVLDFHSRKSRNSRKSSKTFLNGLRFLNRTKSLPPAPEFLSYMSNMAKFGEWSALVLNYFHKLCKATIKLCFLLFSLYFKYHFYGFWLLALSLKVSPLPSSLRTHIYLS